MPVKKSLDARDRAILAALLENPRIRDTDLAKQVGLSNVAVRGRITWLEARGLILGYRTLVASGALHEGPLHWAFIAIETPSRAGIERFEQALAGIVEIKEFDRLVKDGASVLKVASAAPERLLRGIGAAVSVAVRDLQIKTIRSSAALRGSADRRAPPRQNETDGRTA